MMEKGEITVLFDQWNSALQTGDPKQVAALYATDAILLPTVSNQVRHNHQEIEDYFVHFLAKGPQGKIDESNVRIIDDIAINSGVYTFTFTWWRFSSGAIYLCLSLAGSALVDY
jgi:uncharacterized protein (TIGR02246 family)